MRFTIRDLMWATLAVALSVALWVNRSQHRVDVGKLAEENSQLKRASKTWQSRAESLRRDVMSGTNKATDVEFIPDGIKYTPKKANSELPDRGCL